MIEEIKEKIKASLEESDFEAILANGADNIQYLSEAPLPFLYSFPNRYIGIFWPKKDDPTAIIPTVWKSSFENLSWINKTITYSETPGDPRNYVEAVAHLARTTIRKTSKIGIDTLRTSQNLFEKLVEALEDFELAQCDGFLRNLRMIKTPGETSLLEYTAQSTDHSIFGAAHHVLVTMPRSEMSLSEEIRVHSLERELDVIGHHSVSQAASGPHSVRFWPLAPNYGCGYDKELRLGEYVRMEMKASKNGYWSNAARMMTMGDPTKPQMAAYNGLTAIKRKALETMKTGNTCSHVYHAMKSEATEKGLELISGLPLGHSVGITDREAPYISPVDDTKLREGMVLILDPLVKGPDGEILSSKDTVIISEEGANIIGWYINWHRPYTANYTL